MTPYVRSGINNTQCVGFKIQNDLHVITECFKGVIVMTFHPNMLYLEYTTARNTGHKHRPLAVMLQTSSSVTFIKSHH